MRLLAIAAWLFWTAAANPDFISAQRKFDRIENDKCRPGERVFLSVRELNAYARGQAAEISPEGIRDLQVTLGMDTLTASARVDFLALNKARGGQSNWLMEKFFSGERPVKVLARVQSGNGKARVDADRVEVGGAGVEGSALQFLIERYVIPEFPDAKVAQWFLLSHRVERIEGRPGGATIVISK